MIYLIRYKFETVVPVAFQIAAKAPHDAERQVRLACRDVFLTTKLLGKIIPAIEEMLAAGEVEKPTPGEGSIAPAFSGGKSLDDAGHRH